MYVLNINQVKKTLHARGYSGLKPFLERIGLHRNTLDRYVRGAPVLPASVAKALAVLEIPIEHAIYMQHEEEKLPIDSLVTSIHTSYPQISIFLFGSRARKSARKYSDFDIGVYSQSGVSFSQYLAILEKKEDYEEHAPEKIDCVNLNLAEKDFLISVVPDLRLLAGYERDTIELREKAYE